MGFSSLAIITSLAFTSAMAFPRETAIDNHLQPTMTVTAAAPPVTEAANLHCSNGSTVLFTTDCTLGTPVSYCHKPRPPISCRPGFFPSVWHPDHCMEQSTCFPLNAAWITTECSNGALPLTTTTLFEGTLAGGISTVVSSVSCSCPADQWSSITMLAGPSELDTFCMPRTSCPSGMTTSFSRNELCATTATAGICADVPTETSFCQCVDPMQTPVYPDEPGAAATGCEY